MPQETQQCSNSSTWVFIAALFTNSHKGNYPNIHQLVNGWSKCAISMQWNDIQWWKWGIDTCYNMDRILEPRCQLTECKITYCMTPFTEIVQNWQIHTGRKQTGGCQAWGWGIRTTSLWVWGLFLERWRCLALDSGDGHTKLWMHEKAAELHALKWVKFWVLLSELYPIKKQKWTIFTPKELGLGRHSSQEPFAWCLE